MNSENSTGERRVGLKAKPPMLAMIALVIAPFLAFEGKKVTSSAIPPHEWNLIELRKATTDDLVICVDESRTTSSRASINWAILVEDNRNGHLFGYYVRERVFERVPSSGYAYETHPPKDCEVRIVREPATYESLGRVLAKKKTT